ncbi:hypothetical protein [Nocardioides sp. SYSU DS0651]|uniref:hypothetical protein n=1 Tax=Nocardioides sp. SYSU DS0651 TaxID=3415955 RepID=UPI003F4B7DBB
MSQTKTNSARRGIRLAGVSAAAVLSLGGLAACGDSAGPESGEVTTEDLQEVQDELSALEDRVGGLEEDMGVDSGTTDGAGDEAIIGKEVTVSAEISELITSNDSGTAFRIGGESGAEVAVLASTPPEGLDQDDVVQITGTVHKVQRDSFEDDFGVAEDDLFDDPDAFFEDAEGQLAIAATSIEVLEEQPDE